MVFGCIGNDIWEGEGVWRWDCRNCGLIVCGLYFNLTGNIVTAYRAKDVIHSSRKRDI